MGDGIAVLLAENEPENFDGVFALGAYLHIDSNLESTNTEEIAPIFTGKTQLPILFVSNTGEMVSSLAYIGFAKSKEFIPEIWKVSRTGHVNVNSAERIAGIRALVDWIGGAVIRSKEDATLVMTPTSVAAVSAKEAVGNISGVRPLYGNIYTNFVTEDLEALGIEIGTTFSLTHGVHTKAVTFAKAYSEVPLKAWVAFIDPEGHAQFSRNYANAAETLDAKTGDPLLISNKP